MYFCWLLFVVVLLIPSNSSDTAHTDVTCAENTIQDQLLENVKNMVSNKKSELLSHEMYSLLTTASSLQVLMKSHVFCVWDFMSLVKRLQLELTTMSLPWLPPNDSNIARFINEIIVNEETDGGSDFEELEQFTGIKHLSHFELYLKAMEAMNVDQSSISGVVNNLKNGININTMFNNIPLSNPAIIDFVQYTLNMAINGSVIDASAAFLLGREDIIPPMFREVQRFMPINNKTRLFWLYLQRHIDVDEGNEERNKKHDSHQMLGEKLLRALAGTDEKKWKQIQDVALESLNQRYLLWNGVAQEIKKFNQKSLFDKIGAENAVKLAVDIFYEKVLSDKALKPFFNNTDITKLKNHQRRFLTVAFGGKDVKYYNGRTLQNAHANARKNGLNLVHFNKVVQHLTDTLKQLNIAQDLIDSVFDIVISVKNDILME